MQNNLQRGKKEKNYHIFLREEVGTNFLFLYFTEYNFSDLFAYFIQISFREVKKIFFVFITMEVHFNQDKYYLSFSNEQSALKSYNHEKKSQFRKNQM